MDDLTEIITPEWIRKRWGGTWINIKRNPAFSLDVVHGNLWLHVVASMCPIQRLMLKESPTRQDVIDAERVFGVVLEGQ